jgi:tRNA(Ile)-lysidine synthase
MHAFLRQLITEWRRLDLPFEGKTVIVAVSGGADSVSLLLALHRLKELGKIGHRIVAAHFNHSLRGSESDDDEEFVRQLTAGLNIEFAAGRAGSTASANIEQHARTLRYDFLARTAGNLRAFAVLTGHTVDDQAETFLLNLIRGSGTRGLSGMRAVRDLNVPGEGPSTVLLVRPLLSWARRRDTEGYCRELDVAYRYDTMNEDESFKRVRVRKVLIPLLEDFNPRIVQRLAETADLLRIEAGDGVETTPSDLSLEAVRQLEADDLYRLLRAWLEANRGDLRQIELKHIQAIERLIHSRKSGKSVQIPGGEEVLRQGGMLVFRKNKVEKEGSDI